LRAGWADADAGRASASSDVFDRLEAKLAGKEDLKQDRTRVRETETRLKIGDRHPHR
jgi:hypothetical protein